MTLFFGICFFLYFLKLSAGRGFLTKAFTQACYRNALNVLGDARTRKTVCVYNTDDNTLCTYLYYLLVVVFFFSLF